MTPKNFAILRIQKIKSLGGLAGRARHNLRQIETPNADPNRKNIVRGPGTAAEVTAAWRTATEGLTVRKNAVYAVEYLLTASPEFFKTASAAKRVEWAKKSLKFIEDKHGAENVLSAVLHLDETTPHWQILVVPLDTAPRTDKKTKKLEAFRGLNARAFFGGAEMMSKLQDDYHAQVAGLGLERGLKGSKAKHQSVKNFYRLLNQVSKPVPKPSKTDFAAAAIGIETSTLRAHRKALAGLQRVAGMHQRDKHLKGEVVDARKAKADAEKEQERANARTDAMKRKNVELENQLSLTKDHLLEQTKALELQAVEIQYLKQKDGNKVLPFSKPR